MFMVFLFGVTYCTNQNVWRWVVILNSDTITIGINCTILCVPQTRIFLRFRNNFMCFMQVGVCKSNKTSTQSLCRLTARWPASADFSQRVLPPSSIVSSSAWISRRWPWEKYHSLAALLWYNLREKRNILHWGLPWDCGCPSVNHLPVPNKLMVLVI